ncbi:MAG: cohesin domain-containing protein, partial [Euryarchaeota archaeon]|nr:cohesin domain-containing protein [Euryarchaeota archaeon]
RRISASKAGCITYDGIPDFVICTQIYDVDANTYIASVSVIDGSNGVELWSESRSGTGNCRIDADPVEDLNCDRTTDILVNIKSYDEDANTHDCSVAAISGLDGVYLWEESISGTGDGWLYADSVEDIDSDGIADFLIEINIWDIDWDAGEMLSCDCSVTAISGSDGTHLWEESMSGTGYGWMGVDFRDLDGDDMPDFLINFESGDWSANTFNSSLVALKGSDGTHFWDESISGAGIGMLDADSVEDLDGDGITDFLIEIDICDIDWDTGEILSCDCSVTAISGINGTHLWEESVSGTGIVWLYSSSVEDLNCDGITDFLISTTTYDVDWDAQEMLSYDCSVTAISGSDGTHLWEESASGTGAGDIGVDFCDLDYDNVPEFLICIESYDWDTNAYDCRIIAVNGSDGTHIWDTSMTGSGYGWVYAYPLDDLNCDGTVDILVDFRSYDIDWDAGEMLSYDCSVTAISGSDGTHLWEESVSGTGFGWMRVDFCDLDYDGVLEFLISTESCDLDANTYDFSLLVLNGSDGTHLWSDSKSGSGYGSFGVDLVEDLDCDFWSDIIVSTSVYDEIADTYTCSVSAKRGCDGSDIWVESMSGTGDTKMGIYEIVDLDRDGVSDVVVVSGEFVYETIRSYGMMAISGCDGHEIWTVDSNDYVDWSYRSGDFNGDGSNEMVLTTSDSVCVASGAVPFPVIPTIGDLNHDGDITTVDARIALEIAAGSRPYDPAADIDRNRVVNSLDARMILTMAQKIQVSVNAPEEVFDTFNATIDIEDVFDMNCGQFDLSFDPDVLNVTGVHDGCIGNISVPVDAWRLMDAGTIRVLFNLPGLTGVTGSGQVTTISFEVTGSPGDTSVLNVSDGLLVDVHGGVIPADWTDDVVSVGGAVILT